MHRAARDLQGRVVGVGGTSMKSPTTMAPRPNGLPMLARSQELKSKRREVATAVGAIGRPEILASVTMPRPATRGRFDTSAVNRHRGIVVEFSLQSEQPRSPALLTGADLVFRPNPAPA